MVNITITNGSNTQTINIEWKSQMNAQQAIEIAFNEAKGTSSAFNFALQYYGYSQATYLGYMILMMDNIFDNSIPNNYWLFFINGALSAVGIDSYIVNDNDALGFTFEAYPATHTNDLHAAKQEYFSNL